MSRFVSYLWRVFICAVAYFAGAMVGASVAPALGATLPAMPPSVSPGRLAVVSFLASLTLGAGLGPLAMGFWARFPARFAALALLAFVCLGVNTALESAIFTTVGGGTGMIVLFLPATLACAAAAAALFPPTGDPETWASGWRRFVSQFPAASWLWRVALAVLAFPVIYLAFGSVVGPFVIDAYRSGAYGLKLPGMGQIIPTQFVRSALFLLASVPALVLWRGPRLRLAVALGLAHYVFVGLFGMLQALWLPGSMRLLHGAELLADSMTYAAALVVLLVAPAERPGPTAGSWDAEVF
jgi:hypothetical protein